MERIPVAGPSITQLEIDYVTDAVTNCWYGNSNKYHERFEKAFAEYIGVKYAIALPSCTSAIHLSLSALGIGAGDEVIVPDVTWIASAAPITYVGASPVFADIDPKSWCLCPKSLARKITDRTKAIVVVDLYGNLPEFEAITDIAKRHNLAIIEDAAEAFGSMSGQRKAGCFGEAGVFSFHGSKTMTTGEGGMLVTDHKEIHDRVQILRDHGRTPGDVTFFNNEVAFKYKMSSLQAALGLGQIERAEELIALKRQIFRWYHDRLSGLEGVTLNPEAAGTRNSYWMSTIVLDPNLGLKKEAVIKTLSDHQIDSRPFFHPLSHIPAFCQTREGIQAKRENTHSYAISPYGVNLPCGLSITEQQVDRVSTVLHTLISQQSVKSRRVA